MTKAQVFWINQKAKIIDDFVNSKTSWMRMWQNLFRFNSETWAWSFLSSNLLRFIAVISMFLDHTGFIVFPEQNAWRIIGRWAFPIFAFLVAIGSYYSHNLGRYTLRFLILALLFQSALWLGTFLIFQKQKFTLLDPFYLNIYFQLFFGAFSIYLYKKHWGLGLLVNLVLIVVISLISQKRFLLFSNYRLDLDYGIYGYLLIIGFYGALKVAPYIKIFNDKFWFNFKIGALINLAFLTLVFSLFGFSNNLQIYALFCSPFLLFFSPHRLLKMRWLRQFFIAMYPLSFLVPFLSIL